MIRNSLVYFCTFCFGYLFDDLLFKPICGLFTPLLMNFVIQKLEAEFKLKVKTARLPIVIGKICYRTDTA